MSAATMTAPVAVVRGKRYACQYKDATIHLTVSSEAMRYVNFARLTKNEGDLRGFLEYVCRWVDIRTRVLKLGLKYRDEVLANLWLWARLEHAANLSVLAEIFRQRIQDKEIAKKIFHNKAEAAKRYLASQGKIEPLARRVIRT